MKKLLKVLPIAAMMALMLVLATSCSQTSDLSMQEDVDKMLEVTGEATDEAEDVAYKLAYDMDLADDSTGFRTAGSDAEHRAADYLVEEFEKIGLEDVTKDAVTVDKWQFNEAYMNISYTNKSANKKSSRT